LRVASPGVPTVRIRASRLQANQAPVRRSRIDIPFGQCGLEGHRRLQGIREADGAVSLAYSNEITCRAGEIQIVASDSRRRKNLATRSRVIADDYSLPGLFSVRRAHRVDVVSLRVQDLPFADCRARALIRPGTGDRIDADSFAGLGELGGCRRGTEPNGTIQSRDFRSGQRHASAIALFQ